MRWPRWAPVLAALATLGTLLVAGRLLDLGEGRPLAGSPAASPPTVQRARATAPVPPIPPALLRPLRLPSPPPDGSCPASRIVRPPKPHTGTVAAVALGRGPVYPTLLWNAVDGTLDRTSAVWWDAPRPLGGVAIVRGHRLGAPRERVGFEDDTGRVGLVQVLDPAMARQAGRQGHWWHTSRLHAGSGCFGLQIDGPGFSQVLVLELGS
jgi:hypothetical protein